MAQDGPRRLGRGGEWDACPGKVRRMTPVPSLTHELPLYLAGHLASTPAATTKKASCLVRHERDHMEGGDTGVHEAMRQAWAEASYWLSGRSVAVAAPSYSGDPEEEEAEPGWVSGAGWVEDPRKNWAPSPLDIPAG